MGIQKWNSRPTEWNSQFHDCWSILSIFHPSPRVPDCFLHRKLTFITQPLNAKSSVHVTSYNLTKKCYMANILTTLQNWGKWNWEKLSHLLAQGYPASKWWRYNLNSIGFCSDIHSLFILLPDSLEFLNITYILDIPIYRNYL